GPSSAPSAISGVRSARDGMRRFSQRRSRLTAAGRAAWRQGPRNRRTRPPSAGDALVGWSVLLLLHVGIDVIGLEILVGDPVTVVAGLLGRVPRLRLPTLGLLTGALSLLLGGVSLPLCRAGRALPVLGVGLAAHGPFTDVLGLLPGADLVLVVDECPDGAQHQQHQDRDEQPDHPVFHDTPPGGCAFTLPREPPPGDRTRLLQRCGLRRRSRCERT